MAAVGRVRGKNSLRENLISFSGFIRKTVLKSLVSSFFKTQLRGQSHVLKLDEIPSIASSHSLRVHTATTLLSDTVRAAVVLPGTAASRQRTRLPAVPTAAAAEKRFCVDASVGQSTRPAAAAQGACSGWVFTVQQKKGS